jgi:urease accessory protein
MQTAFTRVVAFAAALAPTTAFAHGVIDGHGFGHGFSHPFGGIDHVLAMVAVGILAWQLGGRALLLLPLTFVTVMAMGGLLGAAGLALSGVEIVLAASVVVLGAVVALGATPSLAIVIALVGLFALFHGHAHGAGMPLEAVAVGYGAGFLAATAVLHGCGMAFAALVGRIGGARGRAACRLGGAGVAAAGIALLLHAV